MQKFFRPRFSCGGFKDSYIRSVESEGGVVEYEVLFSGDPLGDVEGLVVNWL